MTLDLRNTPADKRDEAAAAYAGVPVEVLRGMWKVESERGANMNSEAGARGHFQTMPKTQATWEARTGRKYNPYDYTDSLTLAALTMRENMGMSGGDLDRALAIYHGGPDERAWGPRTRSYAQKVRLAGGAGRGPVSAAQVTADVRASGPGRDVSFAEAWRGDPYQYNVDKSAQDARTPKDTLSEFQQGAVREAQETAAVQAALRGAPVQDAASVADGARREAQENLGRTVGAAIEQRGNLPATDTDQGNVQRAIEQRSRIAREDAEFEEGLTALDYFGAAFSGNMTAGAVRAFDRSADEFVPGWKYEDHMDEIEQPWMTGRDRAWLREEGTSPAAVARITGMIKDDQYGQRIMGTMSTGGQVGLSVFGSLFDPVGIAATWGIGKVANAGGVGVRAAVQAGKPGRALAIAASEGGGTNLLSTAVLDGLGEYRTTGDYATDASVGVFLGTGLGMLDFRDASITKQARQWAGQVQARTQEAVAQARADLGPNATPAQVTAKASQIMDEQEDAWQRAELHIPDEDRFFARPDVMTRPQAPEPVTTPVASPERLPLTMQTELLDDVSQYTFKLGGREVALLEVDADGGVISARVDDAVQGQGVGSSMYATIADKLLSQGRQFKSDGSVTEAAARVWEHLGKNEFVVEKNPTAKLVDGAWLTDDGEAVFTLVGRKTVTTTPEATRLPTNSVFKSAKQRNKLIQQYDLEARLPDKTSLLQVAEAIGRVAGMRERYPVDAERARSVLGKVGLEATSTRLLLDDSDVSKAVGALLMENPEGAAGRGTTASITRSQLFDTYMGNTQRDVDAMFSMWRRDQGHTGLRTVYDPSIRRTFDTLVAEELSRRWTTGTKPKNSVGAVSRAADAYDAAYARMGKDQVDVGAIGAERIEVGKMGYFQRVYNLSEIAELSHPRNAKRRNAVLNMFETMFREVEGMYDQKNPKAGDVPFTRQLAREYLQRLEHRAAGLVDAPANLYSDESAKMLREAMTAMRMNEEEIQKVVGRFSRGGAGHTKGRIDMDALRTFPDGEGGELRLLDLLDTNMPDLFRRYASRTSGDVALAKFGVMGEQGAKVLREAMRVTGASNPALEAYDQFIAEMLGKQFGTGDNKYLANARLLTGSTKLGFAGVVQAAAYVDAVIGVGLGHTLSAIKDLPRLFQEVRALARGEKVDSLLTQMETLGPTFGMSDYRTFGLYDVNDTTEIYGREQIGVVSRFIRSSSHAVRILSGHRAILAVQTRGMAEQVVHKAWKYIRDGAEDDAALADMGLSKSLIADLRKHMDDVIEWDAAGNVKVFDPRKVQAGGEKAMLAFRDLVWRGASQLVQREFAGEIGKWAHSGYLKTLFQFRTFSLSAHQKQFARNRAVHGNAKTLGYILGSLSVTMPIHLARVYQRALLLPDDEREKYIEENTSLAVLARSGMNYMGQIGVLSDVLDVGTGFGVGWVEALGGDVPDYLKPTGGRGMGRSDAIGETFVPAVGMVNTGVQGAFGNPGKLVRTIPGNNLPYILPAWLGAEAHLKD